MNFFPLMVPMKAMYVKIRTMNVITTPTPIAIILPHDLIEVKGASQVRRAINNAMMLVTAPMIPVSDSRVCLFLGLLLSLLFI